MSLIDSTEMPSVDDSAAGVEEESVDTAALACARLGAIAVTAMTTLPDVIVKVTKFAGKPSVDAIAATRLFLVILS